MKLCRGLESQAQRFLGKSFVDPVHSGLSVGLKYMEAELTQDRNISTDKGSRPTRSESAGSDELFIAVSN